MRSLKAVQVFGPRLPPKKTFLINNDPLMRGKDRGYIQIARTTLQGTYINVNQAIIKGIPYLICWWVRCWPGLPRLLVVGQFVLSLLVGGSHTKTVASTVWVITALTFQSIHRLSDKTNTVHKKLNLIVKGNHRPQKQNKKKISVPFIPLELGTLLQDQGT